MVGTCAPAPARPAFRYTPPPPPQREDLRIELYASPGLDERDLIECSPSGRIPLSVGPLILTRDRLSDEGIDRSSSQ